MLPLTYAIVANMPGVTPSLTRLRSSALFRCERQFPRDAHAVVSQ